MKAQYLTSAELLIRQTEPSYITPTYCGFRWDFPVLDFKLLNNRPETLFLTEVLLDVDESSVDIDPFLAIQRDVQQSFAGSLLLRNEGGCELKDLRIAFHLLPGLVADPPALETPYPHSVSVPLLTDRLEVDVTDAFEAEGADITGLILLSNGKWESKDCFLVPTMDGPEKKLSSAEVDERVKKFRGPFKDAVGTLVGEITVPDSCAESVERRVKFRAYVYIENENRRSLPRPPTFAYDTVFDSQNLRYQKRLPISHELKSGEADRFTVKIAVPQSSYHRFRVIVRDISGLTLQSPPIEMRCFVPRSRQKVVKDTILARQTIDRPANTTAPERAT